MKKRICICLGAPVHRSIFLCLAFVTMFSMFLLITVTVEADSVTINDQAGALDTGRVQTDAAQLADPMLIYTTATFTGDQSALDQSTRAQLPDQNAIAIGIGDIDRFDGLQVRWQRNFAESSLAFVMKDV